MGISPTEATPAGVEAVDCENNEEIDLGNVLA